MSQDTNLLIQQLLPYLGGQNAKQATSSLNIDAKTQAMLKSMMAQIMSPQTGVLTGTYDPMILAQGQQQQQQSMLPFQRNTPSLDAAMSDPIIGGIASQYASGQMSDTAAQMALSDLVSQGQLGTLTPDQAIQSVQTWRDELTRNNTAEAKYNQQLADQQAQTQKPDPNNPYTKAGLPQPTEQYTATIDPTTGELSTNVPIDTSGMSQLKAKVDSANTDLQRQQQAVSTDFSGKPQQTVKNFDGIIADGQAADPSGLAQYSPLASHRSGDLADTISTLTNNDNIPIDHKTWREAVARWQAKPENQGKDRMTYDDLRNAMTEYGSNFITSLAKDKTKAAAGTQAFQQQLNQAMDALRRYAVQTPQHETTQAQQANWMPPDNPQQTADLQAAQQKVNQAQRDYGMGNAYSWGEAQAAGYGNRTPLNDALQQRIVGMLQQKQAFGL